MEELYQLLVESFKDAPETVETTLAPPIHAPPPQISSTPMRGMTNDEAMTNDDFDRYLIELQWQWQDIPEILLQSASG